MSSKYLKVVRINCLRFKISGDGVCFYLDRRVTEVSAVLKSKASIIKEIKI